MSEQRTVACSCGTFEVSGTIEELVPIVQAHAKQLHNLDATPEQVFAWSVAKTD